MKKIITLLLLSIFLKANAQIGGGWDWAFNTGSFGGTTYKHLKYSADGSEILMAGQALGAVYFGSTTLTASPQSGYPGNIKFFGKINAATSATTIIRSFINIPVNFDCITTDDAGNFYIGGAFVGTTDFDFGNGVIVPGTAFKMGLIAKFNSAGTAIWAKTFQMGATGTANNQILKLAVTNSGNIYFWGFNPNSTTTVAPFNRNTPLYKLDSSGNTLWFKDAINPSNSVGNVNYSGYLSDKFIDNNENVHLFVSTSSPLGYTFNGISYPGGSTNTGSSTLISLNSSGNLINAQTYDGGVSHFQVNRTTGNLIFGWNQFNPNPGAFQNLPHPLVAILPSYVNAFSGMMEIDNSLNFVKAKDFSSTIDNPFSVSQNYDMFLSLPNGKMLIATDFANAVAFSAGVNSFYPAESSSNYATALLETDIDWNISKFITGGKAPTTEQTYLSSFNDTYLIGAGFYAAAAGMPTTLLPTTSFGTVNLTGFNAASDFTTAYGSFSTNASFRFDVALAQCKSVNFPVINSTTWLGITNNWNTPSNWSNGVPTNLMKAVFNAPTPFYPTVSSSPTSATLEVQAGVTLPLPTTLALVGGLKNEGTIVLNNTGFFQGLGSNEWKGSGSVNFTGTIVNYFYGKTFTNSIILNADISTNYAMSIPNVTFNSGKFNLNSKKLTVTNANPTSISGVSATSYFYGGTLERKINATGLYEFPLGTNTNFQSATINALGLTNVNSVSTTFTNGAITGTTPNTTIGAAIISSALNSGWYSITPNMQPSSGSYDVLLKLKSATNYASSPAKYAIIKRDNATSPWSVQGNYNLATDVSGTITASNTNLTSFSDFAIGIANQDVVLSSNEFENFRQNLRLYPNPTSSELNISLKNSLVNGSLKIISITGQMVLEQKNLSGLDFSTNVSNLNQGIYLIQITDESSLYHSKFIKK